MKGNVFNIQKYSIHDGPGIRTTVFLKGCPLRCKWCSNPESQKTDVQISYDSRKCIGCHSCVHSCTNNCISYLDDSEKIKINNSECITCLTCVNSCPTGALKSEGENMDLELVVKKCLQDIDFYEESGGGVTLSGGECMYQPEFTKALITELKKYHIHVAAETTGYIEKNIFKEIAPKFDLLLFDVKHYDSKKHYEGTGVHNERIIENLRWANDKDLNILPRIPVIPGFNSSLEDAAGLAELLNDIGLKDVQLLPFHQFGERKYELLNMEYSLKNIKGLQANDLQEYQNIFTSKGLNCFI